MGGLIGLKGLVAVSTPTPGRRERSKNAKRERIFVAAAELFSERGFAAVTTRQIAERADVADGTLFRYATSKSELLLMVYNAATADAIDEGTWRAAEARGATECVFALVEPLIELGRKHEENAVVYQRELLFGSAADEFRSQGLDTVVGMEQAIAELLRSTLPSSASAPSPDDQQFMYAARAIFALVHMAIAYPTARHRSDESPTDPIQVLRAQIDLIIGGLTAA